MAGKEVPVTPRIEIGKLARDQYGRTGIVVERVGVPPDDWIAEQKDLPLKGAPHETTWWKVVPITGGLIVAPEPALDPIRTTTYEDFLDAVDHANVPGRRRLAEVFPEFVQRAARELEARE